VAKLVVSDALYRVFAGAVASVCRADGHFEAEEARVLGKVLEELFGRSDIDSEVLLMSEVSAEELSAALRDNGAFRSSGTSSRDVATAFVTAARDVAGVGDGLALEEGEALARYARTLGVALEDT